MAPHRLCLPSPGLLAMAVWFSLSSGLVTTMEVSGVTKWYLRDSSKAWAVRISFSSPWAFLLWGRAGVDSHFLLQEVSRIARRFFTS